MALSQAYVAEVPSADSSFHVVDFKRNGNSVSVEPTPLKISDGPCAMESQTMARLLSSYTQSAPSSSIPSARAVKTKSER